MLILDGWDELTLLPDQNLIGCEFIHKSLHEFAFAQAVVDNLKRDSAGADAQLGTALPLVRDASWDAGNQDFGDQRVNELSEEYVGGPSRRGDSRLESDNT